MELFFYKQVPDLFVSWVTQVSMVPQVAVTQEEDCKVGNMEKKNLQGGTFKVIKQKLTV